MGSEGKHMNIHGSCHCGNIAFDLDWPGDSKEIPARACTCTFCRKHGGVWTSNPQGRLQVTVSEPAEVSRYAFGTKTASFHICSRCGAVPVVTSEIDGHVYAVVSVNAFDNVEPERLKHASATFDGETEGDRLARRVRNWIPEVRIAQAA
jgi:hypothetical protein